MPRLPNIIVITTHDTGRYLGCYGVDTVHTPALDGLAASGFRFANCFCASPVCSPSRGAAMTGRWPQSNGLMGRVHNPWLWELNADEEHLAAILRSHGYRSLLFNVQHEARDWERLGFERSVNCRPEAAERTTCLDTARAFRQFVESEGDGDAPFYAQVGFFETHTPHDFGDVEPDTSKGVTVPPRLVRNAAAEAHMAQFQGAVRRMDEGVGAILGALDGAGLTENTLVVFTSDHGYEAARDKWHLFDPGIAVPLLVRWPGGRVMGGKTVDAMLSNVDLAPSLLELAGLPVPENMQGRSVADAFDAPETFAGRDAVFAMFAGRQETRGVRTRTHKLIVHFSPYRELVTPVDIADQRAIFYSSPVVQMYDLRNDPNEFDNLAADPMHAAVKRELMGRLWQWLEEVDDPLLHGPPRTPFYDMAVNLYRTHKALSN